MSPNSLDPSQSSSEEIFKAHLTIVASYHSKGHTNYLHMLSEQFTIEFYLKNPGYSHTDSDQTGSPHLVVTVQTILTSV